MIHLLTKVKIVDNSGGLEGRCIKILRPIGASHGKIGDLILISITRCQATSPRGAGTHILSAALKKTPSDRTPGSGQGLARGQTYKALIVRTKKALPPAANPLSAHSLGKLEVAPRVAQGGVEPSHNGPGGGLVGPSGAGVSFSTTFRSTHEAATFARTLQGSVFGI